MLKYNLKIAWRNILKNRSNAFINILNLVVGFTTLLLIAFWILYEFSYDSFNTKVDRTYRIAYRGVLMGKELNDVQTAKVLYDAFKENFPEVETATIISNFDEALFRKPDNIGFKAKVSGINPDFFDVFSIPVAYGNIKDLEKPNTIVLSEEMAKKYFGDENPIGKTISTGMDRENKVFTIVGVVGNMPENSHFDFDMLYSNTSQSWYNRAGTNWLNSTFINYVVLKPGTDYKTFESKFNEYAIQRVGEIIKNWKNLSLSEWHATGDKLFFEFQPIKSIHLYSHLVDEYKQNGNILYIYIFLAVGLLVLLVSVINFSNLSTVKSLSRYKEIGVRKVSGSGRKSLLIQYLLESILTSLIALAIAYLLVLAIKPYFEIMAGVKIWQPGKLNLIFVLGMMTLAVFSGLLAGLFPSIVVSGLNPAKLFSSSGKPKVRGVFLKDILIVAQFVISIAAIVGTFVISNQLNFLQKENLGFNKENVLVINGTVNISANDNLLLNERLQKLPYIKSSSSSHFLPSGDMDANLISYKSQDETKLGIISLLSCDHNFDNVYQLELAEGSFFTEDFSKDSRKIVLNERAVKSLGLTDCIGKTIRREGTDYEIICIVKDFHFNSKHSQIGELGIVQIPDIFRFWQPLYCSALLSPTNMKQAITDIEKIWKDIDPGSEFDYSFFDKEYDKLYWQEMQTKKAFLAFSIVATILSIVGLIGFVSYIIQIRTKEIGVRKVNGAKRNTIFTMLSYYFTKPVLMALFISCPLIWFALNKWLQNFAYRINIGWGYFVIAGLIVIFIVFAAVGWLSWRAAKRNPVEALRYE